MLNIEFHGKIVKGEGIATGLGCPTANIAVAEGVVIPGLGVYVGEAEVDAERFQALICINDGRTGRLLKMEVHLIDREKNNLDGKFMNVCLFEKMRGLLKWESDEQMKDLIANDIKMAKQWFDQHPQALTPPLFLGLPLLLDT
ncbi:riboflavin kinase, partial [Patescibacteria group bacterium]